MRGEVERESVGAALRNLIEGYSDDVALGPVVVSIAGKAVVIVTPLALTVWRTGSVPAALVTAGLAAASAWVAAVEIRHRGRPGILSAALAGAWLGGVAFAAFCEWTQII